MYRLEFPSSLIGNRTEKNFWVFFSLTMVDFLLSGAAVHRQNWGFGQDGFDQEMGFSEAWVHVEVGSNRPIQSVDLGLWMVTHNSGN